MIKRLFIVIIGLLLYFGPAYYAFSILTGGEKVVGFFWLALGWMMVIPICVYLDGDHLD